jgi:hypothetical protein
MPALRATVSGNETLAKILQFPLPTRLAFASTEVSETGEAIRQA